MDASNCKRRLTNPARIHPYYGTLFQRDALFAFSMPWNRRSKGACARTAKLRLHEALESSQLTALVGIGRMPGRTEGPHEPSKWEISAWGKEALLSRAVVKYSLSCLVLPAWAVMVLVTVQAAVLCVGADGHVSIEFSQLGKCGSFLSPANPGAGPNESLSGVEDANHCGTCVDTPITQTAVRIDCSRDSPLQLVRAAQPELTHFTFCCSVEGAPRVRPLADVLPLSFVLSSIGRSVVLLL